MLAEAREIAEGVFVDERDEAVEFEKGVLKRSRGEQDFGATFERTLQLVGDDVGGFVNISEAVGFVDNDEIPRCGSNVIGLVSREMVGANDKGRLGGLEWVLVSCFCRLIVGTCFEDCRRKEKFLCQLLMPLLAEV